MNSLENSIEGYAPQFSGAALVRSRDQTLQAIESIRTQIQIGMLESDAYEMAKRVLTEMGVTQNWHRPIIRFGKNTLKTFSEPSEVGVRLAADDIYFLDLGPVWEGLEGDCGATFTVGNDPEMEKCARDVKVVFDRVRTKWLSKSLSGSDLYQFGVHAAQELGWILNLKTDGHRLSEFPHQVYFRGALGEIEFPPAADVWVLEIQIRHPNRPFGAFYEDLLRA